MTPGTVLLGMRHVAGLIALRREASESVRAVRDQLRELGIRDLADQLAVAQRALGRMGDLHRAMESAARTGGTVDGELRVEAARRRQREVA